MPLRPVLLAPLSLLLAGCGEHPIVGTWTMDAYEVNGTAMDMDDWGLEGYEYQGSKIELLLQIDEDLGGLIDVDSCIGDVCASLTFNAEARRMIDGSYDVSGAARDEDVGDMELNCSVDADRLTCAGMWGADDVGLYLARF
jgi:hypothetical protein